MYLITNGQRISGFDEMRVFQSMEMLTDRFEFKSKLLDSSIKANQNVQIYVADELKINGKVDILKKVRSQESVISGTDKTGTLINAYPLNQTGEFKSQTVLDIITSLCAPFDITVSGETGETIPRFNFNLDTKIIDIIAHLCNRTALLAASDKDGNVVLSDASQATSSGLSINEGDNIHDMELMVDMNMRYSSYNIYSQNKFGAFQNSEKVFSEAQGLTQRYKPFVKISDDQYQISNADAEAKWRQQYQDGIFLKYKIKIAGILDVSVNSLVNVTSPYLGVEGQLLIKDITFQAVNDDFTTILTLVSPLTYGGQDTPNELVV